MRCPGDCSKRGRCVSVAAAVALTDGPDANQDGVGTTYVRCPGDCSKRGRCVSVAAVALTDGPDANQDGVGPTYGN